MPQHPHRLGLLTGQVLRLGLGSASGVTAFSPFRPLTDYADLVAVKKRTSPTDQPAATVG